jgi:hypothetical protein
VKHAYGRHQPRVPGQVLQRHCHEEERQSRESLDESDFSKQFKHHWLECTLARERHVRTAVRRLSVRGTCAAIPEQSQAFDVAIEVVLLEDLIQSRVERKCNTARQVLIATPATVALSRAAGVVRNAR